MLCICQVFGSSGVNPDRYDSSLVGEIDLKQLRMINGVKAIPQEHLIDLMKHECLFRTYSTFKNTLPRLPPPHPHSTTVSLSLLLAVYSNITKLDLALFSISIMKTILQPYYCLKLIIPQ